jgi:IS30 family transposase
MIMFIDDHREVYGVEPICKVLPIAPSTYHARVAQRIDAGKRSARARRDAELKVEVRRVFAENFGAYGARKIWRQLQREGFAVARCTVERLMAELGLQGVIRGKPMRTTVSDKAAPCPLDRVNRQFQAARPNALWVSDFTYVATWTGFVYVAFVIDAYARRIVGWRVSRSAHAGFVLDALEQALHDRQPVHRSGLVHQSGLKGSSQQPEKEVAMKVQKRRSDRAGRAPLPSPGRPSVAGRDKRQRFWAAIAEGLVSEDAALKANVPPAVGVRWFRTAGGIRPAMFGPSAKPLSGRYLSFTEREEIALLRVRGYSMQEIARRLGRAASTISRELRRNAATRSGGLEYRATTAQWHAERSARRPKTGKLAVNAALRAYVEERLAGTVVAPGGAVVLGPVVSWKGRRHGRRQARRWSNAWSPEQIARRLPIDFPDDETMRISHEAIYQALFVQGRGALRRELTACLRSGRPLRIPRARTRSRGKAFISPEIMIRQRPPEAADRAVPGHWEGDLILGLGSSAIGTLVERATRFTLLLHLPRLPGYGHNPRGKNGPALAGHGADAVCSAITRTIIRLPEQLRRSLTWDQGAEMAQHARLKIDTGVQVYFCDPQSPWQRGTNENTNGLLRQYFPKGTDLSTHSAEQIAAVAVALNSRPRKALGWKTPAEALDALLLSAEKKSRCDERLNPPSMPAISSGA